MEARTIVRNSQKEVDSARSTKPFKLPPLSEVQPQEYGTARPQIYLQTSQVRLNDPDSLLTSSDHKIIDEVLLNYQNRLVSETDLANLQDYLTRYVIWKGYINSGAVVEDISLRAEGSGGTPVVIDIRGGKLDKPIKISGIVDKKSTLSQSYIEHRILAGQTNNFNAETLRQSYQIFLQDRNIDLVNARIVPTSERGVAQLQIDVTEKPRNSFNSFAATDRSPSVGGIHYGLIARHGHLAIPGDEIIGEIGKTSAMSEGRLSYSAPLGWRGTYLSVSYLGSEAHIIDKPLNELDAVSANRYGAISLVTPLIPPKPGQTTDLTLTLDSTHVKTALLGTPFSFSPGAVDGITDYKTVRLAINTTYFSNWKSYIVSYGLTRGLTSKRSASNIDKAFSYFDLNTEFVFSPNNNSDKKIRIRGGLRYSRDRLYATEMYSLGGSGTVRGYRQNAVLGTRGYWGSVEYIIPADKLMKPLLHNTIRGLNIGLFSDGGHIDRVQMRGYDNPGANLAAIGLAVHAPITKNLKAELYLAKPVKILNNGHDFQDRGIGFRISTGL